MPRGCRKLWTHSYVNKWGDGEDRPMASISGEYVREWRGTDPGGSFRDCTGLDGCQAPYTVALDESSLRMRGLKRQGGMSSSHTHYPRVGKRFERSGLTTNPEIEIRASVHISRSVPSFDRTSATSGCCWSCDSCDKKHPEFDEFNHYCTDCKHLGFQQSFSSSRYPPT